MQQAAAQIKKRALRLRPHIRPTLCNKLLHNLRRVKRLGFILLADNQEYNAENFPYWEALATFAAMRIIAKSTLRAFWEKHPAAEYPLRSWFKEISAASFATPNDVKARYGNASIIANNRVVFNIKGNDFRLIVEIGYDSHIVFILFIGTHAAYDKVNAATISNHSK